MTERTGRIGKAIAAAATRAIRACEDALYPEDVSCDICLEDIAMAGRYRICGKCLAELPYVGEHICLSCGMPMDDEGDYCLRCQNNEHFFKLNRAPFEYTGLAIKMIHDLKFRGKKYMADPLSAFMADAFLQNSMSADIVTFVPMTDDEVKRRGFNQSELLAAAVADRLNMAMLPALVKTKDTSEQKALNARDRAKNLEGAFECALSQVKRRNILLIDDIFTTGATSNECARTLLKAGAREVSCLTAAITKQKMSFEETQN